MNGESVRFTIELHYLIGIFQPKWFYNWGHDFVVGLAVLGLLLDDDFKGLFQPKWFYEFILIILSDKQS